MNCLVTKLKDSVSDTSLKKLGRMYFEVRQKESITSPSTEQFVRITSNAPFRVTAEVCSIGLSVDDLTHAYLDFPANTQGEFYVSNANGQLVIGNAEGIYVGNKYNVTAINLQGNTIVVSKTSEFEYSPLAGPIYFGSLAEGNLKYFEGKSMTRLRCESNEVFGDVASITSNALVELNIASNAIYGTLTGTAPFANCSIFNIFGRGANKVYVDTSFISSLPELTRLSLSNGVTVTGTISNIGNLKKLTEINFQSGVISGKWEDILQQMFSSSPTRRTGNMIVYYGGSNLTLKGTTASVGYYVTASFDTNLLTVKEKNTQTVVATYDGTDWKDGNGNIYVP